MLDDNEILRYLGLELKGQSIIFYDNESEEHLLKLTEIKEISLEKAFIPVQNKVGYWFNKLFLTSHTLGVRDTKTYLEDYRDIYELEIELKNNLVLSRKVKGINLYEIEEFLLKINEIIRAP